tara:strand:+ start:822 stop:1337 length:516 start_codon:yes stop_codon:yes gene_type:complete
MLNQIETRHLPWIILAASIATLGGAYFFEYVLGYMPCHLCLQERIPYFVVIVASLYAGVLTRDGNWTTVPTILMSLCALAFAIGAGLSAYHAGVEYKWWPGPTSCTGGFLANSLEALTAELTKGKHLPQCDAAAWTLFGISLAGYNMLISLALFVLSCLPALRARAQGQSA